MASRVAPQLATLPPENPSVEENRGAIRRVFQNWTKPFLTIWNKVHPPLTRALMLTLHPATRIVTGRETQIQNRMKVDF